MSRNKLFSNSKKVSAVAFIVSAILVPSVYADIAEPTNVFVTLTPDGGYTANWEDNSSSETKINIVLVTEGETPSYKWQANLPEDSTSFTGQLPDYGSYHVNVRYFDANNNSLVASSNSILYDAPTTPPLSEPTNVSVAIDGNTYFLSWQDNSAADVKTNIVRVKRGDPDVYQWVATLVPDAQSYSGVLPDLGTYYIKIRQFDQENNSVVAQSQDVFYGDGSSVGTGTTVSENCKSVTEHTCNIAKSLGKGVNLGNMLDAPWEGKWGVTYNPIYASEIKDAGFDTVRLPINWSNYASEDAGALIDDEYMNRVKYVVDDLIANGLKVIVDMHHYRQLTGDAPNHGEFAVDESVVNDRFVNMWTQISEAFASYSDENVLFELYNEPHNELTANNWDSLYKQALGEVRKTNPERPVVLMASGWSQVEQLDTLDITDNNIIVSLHAYRPIDFSHQGLQDRQTGVTCCDVDQTAQIRGFMQEAKKWSEDNGYPLHIGEWGSSIYADQDSRINFAREMVDSMNTRDIPWTMWNFGSDFGVYDVQMDMWNEPLLQTVLEP